jgi:hypothetical protein
MPSLRKQFPFSEGWIHAKLTLYRDHDLTVEELTRQMNPKGNLEMGHVEITGNRAIVISREIKPTRTDKPCPDCAHDLPGEIMRCPGVYSLCPTCHGKGRIDGTESSGTTPEKALSNLAETRAARSTDH